MPTVLALETSCDESAAAIVRDQSPLASAVATQMDEHARFGGVVPEIASRRHVEALPQLIDQVMAEAGLGFADLDAIAATVTPGLVGALLVGSVTARTLARLHGLPFLGVHHLEGHLLLGVPGRPPAAWTVFGAAGQRWPQRADPVDGPGQYSRLARSRDDAAGEAFDKVARLLQLGYPGGPAIQAAAARGQADRFPCRRGGSPCPRGASTPTTSASVASKRPW
jgi:N6-L-threonylcarbamoyladenine synthase